MVATAPFAGLAKSLQAGLQVSTDPILVSMIEFSKVVTRELSRDRKKPEKKRVRCFQKMFSGLTSVVRMNGLFIVSFLRLL